MQTGHRLTSLTTWAHTGKVLSPGRTGRPYLGYQARVSSELPKSSMVIEGPSHHASRQTERVP